MKEVDPPKRGRPHKQWPTFEELSAWVQQETLTSIAKRLGVSRMTVRYWCDKLGVALPDHGARINRQRFITNKNPILWPSSERLQKMVWDKPVLLIAQDIGVSSTAVKKHCKKVSVETPPRGYWARHRAA